MFFGPLFAAGLLAAVSANSPASVAPSRPTASPVASVSAAAPAPRPVSGDTAPDFVYQSHEELWQSLHNMLEQGSVLLVFGAGDEQLRSLEQERDELVRQGILPVAVIERRDADVWSTVRRLNLTYSLLSDPKASIAEQYGVLDPAAHRAHAAWFVINRSGRISGAGESVSGSGEWTHLALQALGQSDIKAAGAR